MKTVSLGLIILAIAGVVIVLLIQHQTRNQLRTDDQSLRQEIAQLKQENENLSNQLASAGHAKSLSNDEHNELLKLRSEVGMLRRQTNEVTALREQLNNPRQSPSSNIPSEEQQQEMAMHTMDDAHQAGLLLHMFADDNSNRFPTNFDQVARYIGNTNFSKVFSSEFEIVYAGSVANVANPSSAIVVQEREAWPTYDGKWAKVYGFADGHSQLVTEPNDDFTGFERQHAAQSAQNQ